MVDDARRLQEDLSDLTADLVEAAAEIEYMTSRLQNETVCGVLRTRLEQRLQDRLKLRKWLAGQIQAVETALNRHAMA
jgi:hypothetical protein